MAVALCKIHGRSGSTLVCKHVRGAFLENKRIHYNPIQGDILTGIFLLCDDCYAAWKGLDLDNEDVTFAFLDERLQPVCGRCWASWEEEK
jgi:hypothetical protein